MASKSREKRNCIRAVLALFKYFNIMHIQQKVLTLYTLVEKMLTRKGGDSQKPMKVS